MVPDYSQESVTGKQQRRDEVAFGSVGTDWAGSPGVVGEEATFAVAPVSFQGWTLGGEAVPDRDESGAIGWPMRKWNPPGSKPRQAKRVFEG